MNERHDPNLTSDVGSSATQIAVPPSGAERYILGDEIARGGMGIIYQATDTVLSREVAVKVLLERYGFTSGVASRFSSEARITSQLQHPSIPPIHDFGTLADGRPFLAMKLIKGQTLEELLKARTDPSAEHGRFVAVFEQICQALAYAHSHDVIHRDLKPANVMVGAFGEVQVMDWGLAKVHGAETPASSTETPNEATRAWTTQISPTPAVGSHTLAGSLLGTPAFAPPEQVGGEIEKVDTRADVFGLGAILAVILTGKPPYVGETAESVRVQALRGKLDDCFARLSSCAAEPDLVALCKRCLAFEPADRPANAGEVAQAVAELRAAADERARRAELERVRVEGEQATAEAKAAEQQKRRRVIQWAAALVALVLIVGVTLALWQANVATREAANARAAEQVATQESASARAAEAEAARQLQAANAAYALSRDSLVKASADLPAVLEQAIYTREARNRANAILAEALDKQLDPTAVRGLAGRTLLTLQLRAADAQKELGKLPEAEKLYRAALATSQKLQDAGGNDAAIARGNHALVLVRLAVFERDTKRTVEAVRGSLTQLAVAEKLQRDLLSNPPATERTAAELRQSVASTRIEEANSHRMLQEHDPAAAAYREAIELLRPRPDDGPANRYTRDRAAQRASALLLLGRTQISRLDDQAAEEALKESVATYAELLKEDPKNPTVRLAAARASRELGDFLLMRGRLTDVGAYYTQDVTTFRELLQTGEVLALKFELGDAYYRTATLARRQNNEATATDHYTRCRNLWREVTEVNGTVRNQLAVGLAEARLGDHAAASVLALQVAAAPPTNDTIQAVCVLALCAGAVTKGRPIDTLSEADAATRIKYTDAALHALSVLIEKAGYKNIARLKTDPDLDPLREEPRFRELLNRLESP